MASNLPPRGQILQDVQGIICKDRNETHGDPLPQFTQCAALWSAYLGVPITTRQVAICMVLQKISRSCHGKFNADDNRDAIGYAAIWGELDGPATGVDAT